MLQNNLADRGRASKDAWFGGWLPARAFRCARRLQWLSVAALLAVSLASGVQRWERTYGGTCDELGRDVKQTEDGGYIVIGTSDDPTIPTADRLWLVKLDSLGDTLWTRVYGHGFRGLTLGYAVVQACDGGYVAAGHFSVVDGGLDTTCVFLVKADSLGDTLWTRCINRASPDSVVKIPVRSHAFDIEQTPDGGYVVVGMGRRWFASWDFLVVRCDSLGETLWTRTYGGTEDDVAFGVAQAADGGFAIAGHTYSYPHGGSAMLVRVDSLGDTLWIRTYVSPFLYDGFYAVRALPDGGLAAGGYCADEDSSYVLLVKYNALGETLWSRRYGGPGSTILNGLSCTSDGGFMLVGTSDIRGAGGYDVWLIKTDAAGDSEWSRTYGGPNLDYGEAVQQTTDGGYVVAGYTFPATGGGNDLYVIKTDESGISAVGERLLPPKTAPEVPRPRLEVTALGRIRYFLPSPCLVHLELFDAVGRKRACRADDAGQAGWHELKLPGRLPAGAYFARLEAEGAWDVAKFLSAPLRVERR